jgi:dTDP-4-dehydrorhamnose 3,5-epimerase-like enzyme
MYFIKPYFQHRDRRGILYGIVRGTTWREINFVESAKGCVRGGHYHKRTFECFFIISGKANVNVRDIKTGRDEQFVVKGRDIFVVEPFEVHTFEVLEDSKWINMLSRPIGEQKKDFYKLQQ